MATWSNRDLKELESNPNDLPWDDLRVPMQNTRINPTKTEPQFLNWIDGIFAYHFSAGNDADWSLHFAAQVPHSYAEGTNLHPHLHWAPDSTNTGNVVWELDYVVANIGDAFPGTATTLTVTQAASGVDNQHQIVEFGVIDGKHIGISSMLHFRLTRLGDNGSDTFTGNAIPLEFDLHFQKDSDGSYHEYQKLTEEYRKKKGKGDPAFLPGAW